MFCKKCKKELIAGAAYCSYCGAAQIKKPRTKKARGNGLGTVYWDKTSWCAERTFGYETTSEGKLKRVYARKWGFTTKRAALEYLSSLSPDSKQDYTLQDLWLAWSKIELPELSKSTQTSYRIAYKRLGPLKFKKITEVVLSDLEAAIKGLTHDTAKDLKNLFSKLFKRAMADSIVSVNLSEHLRLPPSISKPTEKLSDAEVASLWQAWLSGRTFAGFILLLIYTGMMPGELFKLEKDMINYETQTIIGCGLKTKKRKEMPIVFPDFIAPVLKKLCDISKSRINRVLCMNKDRFYDEFKILKQELNINPEATPYSARRTTGTQLGLHGIPPALITEVMRHTNYNTTVKHYTVLDTAPLVSAVNLLYNSGVNGTSTKP